MKVKYGIAFAAVLLVSATLIGFGYQMSFRSALKRQENLAEVDPAPQSVSAQGEAKEALPEELPGEGYFLAPLHGYVVVYYTDKHTIYEVTNIALDSLPKEVQGEILDGKYIRDDKELYGFLENYSS